MTNERELYPCDDCGKLRTKAEGGTTFTVCDECWDKHYSKSKQPKVSNIEQVREELQDLIDNYGYSLEPSQAEGRREVIEWIENGGLSSRFLGAWEEWQAKLKEWQAQKG